MNHRNPPPPIPPSSPVYRRNASADRGGSFSLFQRSTSNDSSILDTGDVNGYNNHHHHGADHNSMLYYKDKRLRNRSFAAALRDKLVRDPWKLMWSLIVCSSILYGYRNHRHTSRLLREMNVQTVDQAIRMWKTGGLHRSVGSKDVKLLYQTQDEWQKRDAAWRHHVEKLQNHTQRESRRAVVDKFGAGPHHVQISVVLHEYVDPTSNSSKKYADEDVQSFEVELAPIQDMPHSVHLFLEQVSHGLWNRREHLSFHVNTAHIIMAGPTSKEARQAFQIYGLSHLAYPEYSDSFPHEQYTLGFAGRPGGPSFYINTANNSEVHGPGGQEQHVLTEYADSCFAKVVSGFSVLEEILEETDLEHQTMIVGMKIINWNDTLYADEAESEESWYRSANELDMKDDDYTDDVYYGNGPEAGFADDDREYAAAADGDKQHSSAVEADAADSLHHKPSLGDRLMAAAAAAKISNLPAEHHHRHHGAHYQQQKLEESILAADPPRHVDPPPELQATLEIVPPIGG